jgi:hypothetical protein
VTSGPEVWGDRPIGREKLWGVPWGFEALYAPLSLAGGLVGMLGGIAEGAVMARPHARQRLPLGRLIAVELICVRTHHGYVLS